MSTSTIKLYYHTDATPFLLQPDKLFCIEDIASYLSTRMFLTISTFQYIRNELEIEIKVDLSQVWSEPLKNESIRYVSVENNGQSKIYYYYVKKVEQRAEDTIKLSLVMDVLNTFKYDTDYILSDKTKINREHKDRIRDLPLEYGEGIKIYASSVLNYNALSGEELSFGIETSQGEHTYTDTINVFKFDLEDEEDEAYIITFNNPSQQLINDLITGNEIYIHNEDDTAYIEGDIIIGYSEQVKHNYYRKIDYLSEDIQPTLYKQGEFEIKDFLPVDWYLCYRNQNDPENTDINPVDCFVIPSQTLNMLSKDESTKNKIFANDLEAGKYYYVLINRNDTNYNNLQFYNNDINLVTLPFNPYYVGCAIQFYKDNNDIKIDYIQRGTNQYGTIYATTIIHYTAKYIELLDLPTEYNKLSTKEFLDENDIFSKFANFNFTGNSWSSSGLDHIVTINGINDIDKTDSKLIKVIKCPYCPFKIEFDENNNPVIPLEWHTGYMDTAPWVNANIYSIKLKDLSTKFNYDRLIDFSIFGDLIIDNKPNPQNNRNDNFESKIFNSEYFYRKLTYDSFGFVFQLEKLNIDNFDLLSKTQQEQLNIKYVTTSTINSKFLFIFNDYRTNGLGKEDYDNIMPIARNNEVTLYNNAYINYVRTGFNYDVKSKQRTEAVTWGQFGLGIGSTILGLLMPKSIGIPLILAGAVSTLSSMTNAIATTQNQEQSIQQKQDQYKVQSSSVYGSDDVDLMTAYTNNKAKIIVYECSPIMKSLLLDLFYYTGYATSEIAKPNINTRYWFNFLACDPIYNKVSNMSNEIKDELSKCLQSGVTFLHKRVIGGNATWDIEQTKENAEMSLVN